MSNTGITKGLRLAALVGALWGYSVNASADDLKLSRCAPAGSSSTDVDQFYGKRVITILAAALQGNSASLATLVDPTASFSVWDGDSGFKSRQVGVPGVIQFAKAFRPSQFRATSYHSGPIAYTSAVCKWTSTVLLQSGNPREGIIVKFDFIDGLLTKSSGQAVTLTEGDVR